jgi:hypothetical protein
MILVRVAICAALLCAPAMARAGCDKDTDCKGDRICRDGECVGPAPVHVVPVPVLVPAPMPVRHHRPSSFFSGVHPFFGALFGGGPDIISLNPNPAYLDGAFIGALRAGMLAGRFELQLEFSPATYLASLRGRTRLSLVGSVGGFARVGGPVSWPLRVGAGFAVSPWTGEALFQTRLDLLSLAFRVNHLLFEFNFPTYRFMTDLHSRFWWIFTVNLGVTYVI